MFQNLQRPAELLFNIDNNSFCDDEPYSDNEDNLSAASDRKRWIVKIAKKFFKKCDNLQQFTTDSLFSYWLI